MRDLPRVERVPGQLAFDFEPELPDLGHAGLGTCASYHPDDPKLVNQAPYREFAAKRGPNSA